MLGVHPDKVPLGVRQERSGVRITWQGEPIQSSVILSKEQAVQALGAAAAVLRALSRGQNEA